MKSTFRTRALGLLATAAVSLPLAVTSPTGVANAAVPAGFRIENYPTGLTAPQDLADFAYTPDNGFFSLGKRGGVNWTSPDGGVRTIHRFTDLATTNGLGAAAIALGHRYGSTGVTPTVWIIRVRDVGAPLGGPHGESVLSEFPVQLDSNGDPVGLGDERRVLWFPNRSTTPAMNDAVVDPRDGTLWVSVGDGADVTRRDERALDAQDRDSPYGRIMHLDRTGAGVAVTNPGFDPENSDVWSSRTYAKGFRNPSRLRLHPTLGVPVVGDVGGNSIEEQNVVVRGGNYGWPCWEGEDRTPGYRDLAACAGVPNANPPIHAYASDAGRGAALGGLVYQGPGDAGGGYPGSYVGSYFWAGHSNGRILTLGIDGSGTGITTAPAGFADNNGTDAALRVGVPVSLKYAPNGDIAYADAGSNRVRRITYSAGDHAPSTASVDTARSDTAGAGQETTVSAVNRQPVLTLTTPSDTTRYAVGDEVRLSATATDADQPGEQLAVKWTTTLHHCSGPSRCHSHPGGETTGRTFTEHFANHGDDTTLEIRAETTDAAGATVSRTWSAKPKLRTLTVSTNLEAPVSVNGVLDGTRQVTVGSDAGISVPTTHREATFERWSDGNTSSSREFRMPDRDVTLTATFGTPISQRYAREAGLRALLGASTGPEVVLPGVGRRQTYEHGHLYYSESAGVHAVFGAILDTYLAQGGAERLGVPTTDEIDAPGGDGRLSRFAGTRVHPDPTIYWKPSTGARLVVGSIQARYAATGTTDGVHGYPRNSESTTPNGRAQYNEFERGGIYWSGATGARSVYGAIFSKWTQYDREAGFLGLPVTSETGTPDGVGRYNHFEGGSVYWSPASGAHEVHGAIRAKWAGLGWEKSFLGFPTTDELGTPDGVGRFNHFGDGSIYWTPDTGAWEVQGLIRREWARRGWERSALGYPVSDEFAVPGGRRSNFQGGYIEWVDGRINVVVR